MISADKSKIVHIFKDMLDVQEGKGSPSLDNDEQGGKGG